jgi:hypothetical protein
VHFADRFSPADGTGGNAPGTCADGDVEGGADIAGGDGEDGVNGADGAADGANVDGGAAPSPTRGSMFGSVVSLGGTPAARNIFSSWPLVSLIR